MRTKNKKPTENQWVSIEKRILTIRGLTVSAREYLRLEDVTIVRIALKSVVKHATIALSKLK